MKGVHIILLLISASVAYAEQPCASRDYGEDSIVCVCNATYCDIADPTNAEDLTGDALRHYESNKAGMRLNSMTMHFTTDTLDPGSSPVITVQKDVVYQKILGFGGAMTDASALNIASLSKDAQDVLMRQYFSDDGAKYNFIRVPVGGSDFSTHYYAYENDTVDETLEHFDLTAEDYDYKIPYIKQAQDLSSSAIKIFGAAWSAPDWMKNITDEGKHSRLLPQYYQLWADYHVKFLDSYSKEGITFWGMSTQNEPSHGRQFNTMFNSMGWTSDQQLEWLVGYFGPTLEENGYSDLNIMILDDQRIFVNEWSEKIYGNETANNYASGMAVHWYVDLFTPVKPLVDVHENYPDKFILYTEACNQDVTPDLHLGGWTDAEMYISNIIQVTNNWVSGWVDWNIALDLEGGPNWAGNAANAPVLVNATADEFYKQPMYYALAHVSKFIPEDSAHIGLDVENDNDLQTVAFLTPDDIVVVVVHNMRDEDIPVILSDPDKGQVNITISASSINTILYQVISS